MKFNLIIVFITCIGLSLLSCDEKEENKIMGDQTSSHPTLSLEEKRGQEILAQCLKAHGGLDRWNKFQALEYTLINNGMPVYQLTHLQDRRAYIKSQDFEVGFDGKVAWSYPNAENISGKSPAFYYNLDFYFVAIPFVLKDPGVHVVYQGAETINDKPYEVLKVTFANDVGFTPEDIYLLYLDPESTILQMLVYSISYFEKEEKGLLKSAKFYSDYQEVQGLLMPGKMENFEWDDGRIGASKNHIRLFKNVRFLDAVPDPDIFSIREGSVSEKVN